MGRDLARQLTAIPSEHQWVWALGQQGTEDKLLYLQVPSLLPPASKTLNVMLVTTAFVLQTRPYTGPRRGNTAQVTEQFLGSEKPGQEARGRAGLSQGSCSTRGVGG